MIDVKHQVKRQLDEKTNIVFHGARRAFATHDKRLPHDEYLNLDHLPPTYSHTEIISYIQLRASGVGKLNTAESGQLLPFSLQFSKGRKVQRY